MRRSASRRCSSVAWFLRSRGDAPFQVIVFVVILRVPPLARRCARECDCARYGRCGSSARAEMRPSTCRGGVSGCRFLRSRGDAPFRELVGPMTDEVPPLARRCARGMVYARPIPIGSSARAEMRRKQRGDQSRAHGFLRSRGDAPSPASAPCARKTVPPLARRCAFDTDHLPDHPRGSSARAEMRLRSARAL